MYFAAGLFEDLPDFYVSIEMCADQKADYLTFQPDSRKMTMTEYVNYINTNEV